MEVVIMYKRDPRYDGTILQGLVPKIKSESSDTKPNSTPRRRINNIVIQDNKKQQSATIRHRIDPEILTMATQEMY